MPRGRPRKVLTEEVKTSPQAEVSSEDLETPANETEECESVEKEVVKKKAKKEVCCDRCHKDIIITPRNINLTYLTAMAPWHRRVIKERVNLCDDCAKELNHIIDEWLINDGNGVEFM